ncbi:hypothetical protein CI109_101991 [Kwoniella shandongensis]|uniref:Uncharacterized protein n=1 Tax=Kwoniella shandongensis TaxID=1734106 RepID=A0A5M6BQE1_9TREE|nr:uncharacterized protein CI109_006576 [Kwoniella shandongensis]KAA5525114.1 hypothetical protein CI109_006576 [Kwoniella shandongensis]
MAPSSKGKSQSQGKSNTHGISKSRDRPGHKHIEEAAWVRFLAPVKDDEEDLATLVEEEAATKEKAWRKAYDECTRPTSKTAMTRVHFELRNYPTRDIAKMDLNEFSLHANSVRSAHLDKSTLKAMRDLRIVESFGMGRLRYFAYASKSQINENIVSPIFAAPRDKTAYKVTDNNDVAIKKSTTYWGGYVTKPAQTFINVKRLYADWVWSKEYEEGTGLTGFYCRNPRPEYNYSGPDPWSDVPILQLSDFRPRGKKGLTQAGFKTLLPHDYGSASRTSTGPTLPLGQQVTSSSRNLVLSDHSLSVRGHPPVMSLPPEQIVGTPTAEEVASYLEANPLDEADLSCVTHGFSASENAFAFDTEPGRADNLLMSHKEMEELLYENPSVVEDLAAGYNSASHFASHPGSSKVFDQPGSSSIGNAFSVPQPSWVPQQQHQHPVQDTSYTGVASDWANPGHAVGQMGGFDSSAGHGPASTFGPNASFGFTGGFDPGAGQNQMFNFDPNDFDQLGDFGFSDAATWGEFDPNEFAGEGQHKGKDVMR